MNIFYVYPQEIVMMSEGSFLIFNSSCDHWSTDNVHYAVHETIGDLNKKNENKGT